MSLQTALVNVFPCIQGAWDMTSSLDVDYLRGLGKVSWYPVKYKRARLGSDLWILRTNFGSFLGGSHPHINAYCKIPAHLYIVLKMVAANGPHMVLFLPCMAFTTETSTGEVKDARSQMVLQSIRKRSNNI